MKKIKKLIAIFAALTVLSGAVWGGNDKPDEPDHSHKVGVRGVNSEGKEFEDYYSVLEQGIAAWKDGTTLFLLKNITINQTIQIGTENESCNKTLNFNGYGILYTGNDGAVISVNTDNKLIMTNSVNRYGNSWSNYITLDANGRADNIRTSGTPSDTCIEVRGGFIAGGNSSRDGAGIVVEGGTVEMNDGTIVGNVAQGNGAGVLVYSGTFHMKGGKITANTVVNGQGGAVYMDDDGKFKISGSPQIIGNHKGENENNIYLGTYTRGALFADQNQNIEIASSIYGSKSIGVTLKEARIFTSGLYSAGVRTTEMFKSDNPNYKFLYNQGEASLAPWTIVNLVAEADTYNQGTYYTTWYDSANTYIADCEVYYVTYTRENKYQLTKVENNCVKAGTGVILKSTSANIRLTETDLYPSYTSLLTGTDNGCQVTNAQVLSLGSKGVKFYKYSGSVGAHKAYMAASGQE